MHDSKAVPWMWYMQKIIVSEKALGYLREVNTAIVQMNMDLMNVWPSPVLDDFPGRWFDNMIHEVLRIHEIRDVECSPTPNHSERQRQNDDRPSHRTIRIISCYRQLHGMLILQIEPTLVICRHFSKIRAVHHLQHIQQVDRFLNSRRS
jgi:hypothetical protein